MARTIVLLSLKDNTLEKNGRWIRSGDQLNPAKAEKTLSRYSGLTLKDLLSDKELSQGNLLLPVHDTELQLFRIGEREYEISGNSLAGFRIDTGNLMGWVTLPGDPPVRMEITSRFDNGPKQYFLDYMLSRACRVDPLATIGTDNSAGGIKLVPILLFVNLMRKAEPYGLMRSYVNVRKNDFNVKGRIDVSRHIKLNFPVGGRIAYTRRYLTADIPINHLIRHVAEMISMRYKGLVEGCGSAKSFLGQLRNATPSWSRDNRVPDIMRNGVDKVVSHPYHAEHYEPMRQLALIILREEGIRIGGTDENDHINGLVFDGSWVWENYLWSILLESDLAADLVHSDNAEKTNPISPFASKELNWYPDFYYRKSENDSAITVLDAKYKRLDKGMPQSGDVHEVLSYMYALNAKRGLLLYPWQKGEETDEGNVSEQQYELNGFGKGGRFFVMGMKIPQSEKFENYRDFCEAMKESENDFIDRLETVIKES